MSWVRVISLLKAERHGRTYIVMEVAVCVSSLADGVILARISATKIISSRFSSMPIGASFIASMGLDSGNNIDQLFAE